jgi:hypothetical protein
MNDDTLIIKIVGILLIFACLKILMQDAHAIAPSCDCPICVTELPPTNQTKCIEMYGVNEENFEECMWLLENQPALQ